MTPPVHTSVEGSVLVVTIDRPRSATPSIGRRRPARRGVPRLSEQRTTNYADRVLTGAGRHVLLRRRISRRVAEGRGNRIEADIDLDGPMGPTRMDLGKPVIAAIEGHAVAGGSSWRSGATCGWLHPTDARRLLPRWGVPLVDGGTIRPSPSHRSRSGDGHDPHRARRQRRRRWRSAWSIAWSSPATPCAPPSRWRPSWRRFPQHCMRNDRRSAIDQWSLGPAGRRSNMRRRWASTRSVGRGDRRCGAVRAGAGRHGSPHS